MEYAYHVGTGICSADNHFITFAYWFTNVRLRLRCLGFFKTVMYMPNLIMASAFAMLIFSIFSDIDLSTSLSSTLPAARLSDFSAIRAVRWDL